MDEEIFRRNRVDPIDEFIDCIGDIYNFEPVSSIQLNQEEFNRVLDFVRRKRNPRQYSIGVIKSLPRMLEPILYRNHLRPGQVVLYSNEQLFTVTVEVPYSPEEIEEQKKTGSSLDSRVILQFDRRCVQPVGR